jgi:hypothetical protein
MRKNVIVAITDSVPPKTISGRHLMTAGGTQTGVKNSNAGRSLSYFITRFLSSGAELVLRILPPALQEHFMASRRQKVQALKGH